MPDTSTRFTWYPIEITAISFNKLNGIFMSITHQADPAKRARLRWRSRRGLLENDLILTRFLDAQETTLTDDEVDAFTRLLELADNALMDMIMGRHEPSGDLDFPNVHALLKKIRNA